MQNLRFAVRTLSKKPGFACIVVFTLALGIGANTAIFSVVYAALLHSLPFKDPSRLLNIAERRRQSSGEPLVCSYPDFLDWRRITKSYQSLAGLGNGVFTLTGNGDPKNVAAAQVTSNFFSTLGVKPQLGRDFADGEEKSDGPQVVVLSYGFWRTEFGGDAGIIGRAIRLDNKPATVIGVLPPDFELPLPQSVPVWVPLHLAPDEATRRSLRWMRVIARLKPGVSIRQARAEMDAVTAQLARVYPKEDNSTFVAVNSLREIIVGPIRPVLLVLFGAVGFVLLIACANVSNLLMTRSIGRRREFAVRTAMGASRANLVVQLLTESLLLSAAGAFFGLMAAQWAMHLLVDAVPQAQIQTMPFLRNAAINVPVLLFLCAVTLITTLLFGLAPAVSVSRSSVNDILKDESRTGTSSIHARLRNALVVSEIAISLMLLVGAGLLLKSLRALLHQSPGFDSANILAFSVNLPDSSYPGDKEWPFDSPKSMQFEREFSERLSQLPGVRSVGAADIIPLLGGGSIRFVIEGQPRPAGQDDECDIRGANPPFFPTMRVPFLAGRNFSRSDTQDVPWRIIVNQAFANRYFPNEDPVGKRLRFTFNPNEPYREIIGVVGNIAEDDLAAPPPPVIYYSLDQNASSFLSFFVKTAGNPAAFVGAVRVALSEADPQLALIQPQAMDQVTAQSPSVFLRRYPSYLIGTFAALALILAMVGLYGLISYTVTQRTREIGIRVALGAQRNDILRMVLVQGGSAALIGIAVGLAAAIALTKVMTSLLFGVKPTDAIVFGSGAVLLAFVALFASWLPAQRASRVDPMVALRYE